MENISIQTIIAARQNYEHLKAQIDALCAPVEYTELEKLIASVYNFDLYYDYTDDGQVWRRCNEQRKELEKQARALGEPMLLEGLSASGRLKFIDHYKDSRPLKRYCALTAANEARRANPYWDYFAGEAALTDEEIFEFEKFNYSLKFLADKLKPFSNHYGFVHGGAGIPVRVASRYLKENGYIMISTNAHNEAVLREIQGVFDRSLPKIKRFLDMYFSGKAYFHPLDDNDNRRYYGLRLSDKTPSIFMLVEVKD